MKNSSDTIGSRTWDLPASGAVPHYKNALSHLWGEGRQIFRGGMRGTGGEEWRTLNQRACQMFLPGDAVVVGTTGSIVTG